MRAWAGAFAALLLAGAGHAAPFTPASDAEVVERLPAAADPALDFVEDQRGAVGGAGPAGGDQEVAAQVPSAGEPLHRLQDHRRDGPIHGPLQGGDIVGRHPEPHQRVPQRVRRHRREHHAERRQVVDLGQIEPGQAFAMRQQLFKPRQFRAGYAEVAKHGLLGDFDYFNWLEANWRDVFSGAPPRGGEIAARDYAVLRSIQIKAAVVARDERETGDRALLNLGHTFGHAFEAAAGFSDKLLHGEADPRPGRLVAVVVELVEVALHRGDELLELGEAGGDREVRGRVLVDVDGLHEAARLPPGSDKRQLSTPETVLQRRPEARSRLVGGYMVFYSAGSALGAITSTASYAHFGWSGVCAAGAAFSLAALALWSLAAIRRT